MAHRFLIWLIVFGHASEGLTQIKDKILPAEKIIKFIPDKISGFHSDLGSKSKVVKLGNLQYSLAEKTFVASKKRSIKILLFDYKEAPIMYSQATRKFSTFTPIESDSVVLRAFTMTDCVGWETYHVYRKNSQILLGICNRFFLTVEGTGVDLETLKQVVQSFKFETFPK